MQLLRKICPHRARRALRVRRGRRLGAGEPHRAFGDPGAVSVPDLPDRARGLLRLEGHRRQPRDAAARHLAAGGRRPAGARDPQRARHDARRRAHRRRGARGLFRVERRRQPAHRAQPRLQRDRDALDLAAEARVDRLRAGRGLRAAGARLPDRPGAARLRDRAEICALARLAGARSSPTCATPSPAP